MNNLTFKQYRNIDLFIFAVLLAISEAVTTVATNKWFYAQPVAISTTIVFICIVMMRWGGWAIIHAVLGGLVFCIASGAQPQQYVIYIIGNCFAVLAALWFIPFGKEGTRKNPFKLFIFTLSAYVMAQVGRWIVSLFFSGQIDAIIVYLTTDVITLLFAVVIIMLMRNTDGMIEDQKAYLFRLQREREAKNAPVPEYTGYDDEI